MSATTSILCNCSGSGHLNKILLVAQFSLQYVRKENSTPLYKEEEKLCNMQTKLILNKRFNHRIFTLNICLCEQVFMAHIYDIFLIHYK